MIRFRRGFTAAEKTELWDRWQRGESLTAIGGLFGKPSSSIRNQLARMAEFGQRHGVARSGVDAAGTRGDIQRPCVASIGAIDSKAAGPFRLDGEPRTQAQWRL